MSTSLDGYYWNRCIPASKRGREIKRGDFYNGPILIWHQTLSSISFILVTWSLFAPLDFLSNFYCLNPEGSRFHQDASFENVWTYWPLIEIRIQIKLNWFWIWVAASVSLEVLISFIGILWLLESILHILFTVGYGPF